MYHSRFVDKIKRYVLKSIHQIDSTNAVGMIINFGPPSEFDDYLQQIGKVGRDGSQSYSMLLYYGQ